MHLHRNLEVNSARASLVLQLMNKLDVLQAKILTPAT
jgi:hypothetical protein